MFKTVIFALTPLLALAVGMKVFPIREKDYALYNELLKSSNPEEKGTLLSFSEQKREGVRKHVWYQDNSPLYFRIDSEESELFFFHQDNQIEVIEQLGKVASIMQEELFFEGEKPMQKVRYLEAERASYNYNSHLFVAQQVKLWKYVLDGHEPPHTIEQGQPSMHATAHSVEFTLKGEKLDFIAHQMRASVNSKEKSL